MSPYRGRVIAPLTLLVLSMAGAGWGQSTAGTLPRNFRLVAPDGTPVYAVGVSLTTDGRQAVFVAHSESLVPGDTNERPDVFVYDRTRRTYERIGADVYSDLAPGEWGSVRTPAISGNGRIVAFVLASYNEGVSRAILHVHDRTTGETMRIGDASIAESMPSLSQDGRYVAYETGDYSNSSIFLFDRVTGARTQADVPAGGGAANGRGFRPTLSANGRKLLFGSYASNLVAGDTNAYADLFLRDLRTGALTRVNVGSAGQANGETYDGGALSADGQVVVFSSYASNLVPADTNNTADVFVRDLAARTITRVSVDSFGAQANGYSNSASTNASGRYVVFASNATNLARDRAVEETLWLLHDRATGVTRRVDLDHLGQAPTERVFVSAFSANGRYIALFTSAALTAEDTNDSQDLYIRDLGTRTVDAQFTRLDHLVQDISAAGALRTTLVSAREALAAGNRHAACRAVARLEREVQARWGSDLSSAQAEPLFTAVGALGREMGCLDGASSIFKFARWTKAIGETWDWQGPHVLTGDVNGDRRMDVVAGGEPIRVLIGDGRGSVLRQIDTSFTGDVAAVADLNGDGRADVIVRDDSALRLLLSNHGADATFIETRIELPGDPTSIAVGDLTADGHTDVVTAIDYPGSAMLIAGAGNSRFQAPEILDTWDYPPYEVAIVDVTGDSRLDFVYRHSRYLFVSTGTVNGLPESPRYVPGNISNMRFADLDADGSAELVSWEKGRVDVYRIQDGFLGLLGSVRGVRVHKLFVVDGNADGKADLVLWDGRFTIAQGNGDGTFGLREKFVFGESSGSVAAGDMNGDGRMDLVVGTIRRSPVTWSWIRGATILLNRPAVFVSHPNDPTSLGVGTVAQIDWEHARPAGTAFRVDVSRDGGRAWTTIAPRVTARAASGRFRWTVVGPATRTARFRVTSLDSVAASDVNNTDVIIGTPSLTMHAPGASANWGIGTAHPVAWSHNLGTGEQVHVDLSRDDGRTWTRMESDIPLNGVTSSRIDVMASGPPTTMARVRVTWVRDPALSVVSARFRIQPPFIKMIAPTAGPSYAVCTWMPMTWRHNLGRGELVDIELSLDGGQNWLTIQRGVSNTPTRTTEWHWIGAQAASTNGAVRVTWRRDSAVVATVGNLLLGRDEGHDCLE